MFMIKTCQMLCSGSQPTLCSVMLRKCHFSFFFHFHESLNFKCSPENLIAIIFCHWSCQDAEAFELSSSGLTNGVFIKFLKERLLEDEKITVLLDSVAEGEEVFSGVINLFFKE